MAISPEAPDVEETPLLARKRSHDAIYNRFSPARKRVIVSMVSVCGLLPLFTSGTFLPCMPQIAEDLDTTVATVSLAVSISVLASSIGALLGSSYSSYYGRRPVYLWLLPFSVVGSIAVASSETVPQLMVGRFFQSFGVSSGLSVGAGVIGDIYKLEERGTAMGIFFAAVLIGPALAPFTGGMAVFLSSWRSIQTIIGVAVALIFVSMLLFFPETSHPGTTGKEKKGASHPTWRPVLLNFLSPLWMLRSPALFLVAILSFLTLATYYVLMVPIADTIGERYGIKNEALIGACFIPSGIGSMLGAPIAGRLSDGIIAKWKAKRGSWCPEDRLRAAIPGALFLVPFSMLLSGIFTRYIDGTLGLVLNLVCFFMNGLGIDVVLSPCAAYVVDVMHSRSAESMAANSAFRAILLATSIAGILPLIDAYGALAADIVGGVLWMDIPRATCVHNSQRGVAKGPGGCRVLNRRR
ncbi:major facilitator superfamily domain-containing protein [Coprinopsis sp. MPI-PUGE-AT-0042]|nr:major facilitator superfamily domain-containing protein [Coprinopsis sp. MPI-PUGE-AT-0042]